MSKHNCAYCGAETRVLDGQHGRGTTTGVDSYPLDPESPKDAALLAVLGLWKGNVCPDLIVPAVILCEDCYDLAAAEAEWLERADGES